MSTETTARRYVADFTPEARAGGRYLPVDPPEGAQTTWDATAAVLALPASQREAVDELIQGEGAAYGDATAPLLLAGPRWVATWATLAPYTLDVRAAADGEDVQPVDAPRTVAPCATCGAFVTPDAAGTWVDATEGDACWDREDGGQHAPAATGEREPAAPSEG